MEFQIPGLRYREVNIFNRLAILLTFEIAFGSSLRRIDHYHLVDGAKPLNIEKATKSDSTFFFYKDYTVVTFRTGREVGENIVVYKGGTKNSSLESHHDFGHQSAGHFFGIAERYLFIDRGTGPGLRNLEVFDLNKKEFILKDSYQDPIQYISDTLTYWTEDSAVATEKNCKDLKDWLETGNGGMIQRLKKIVLRRNHLVSTKEKRCTVTQ